MAALVIGLYISARIQKPILMAGISASIVLMMLGAGLQPILVILMLYLVFGIAKGLGDKLTSSAMADMYTGRKKATSLGMLHGAYDVGGLLVPLLIVPLKSKLNAWNEVDFVFAGIALIFFVMYLLTYMRTRVVLKPFFKKSQQVDIKAIAAFGCVKRN